MIGYWNNKDETDKVLKNGLLYTEILENFKMNI